MVRRTSLGSSSTSRISIGSAIIGSLIRTVGEIECRALIEFGLDPDAASVLMYDALHGRQSHACAFKIFLAVQALEDPKKLVRVLHVEAYAVVADEDYILFPLPGFANLNDSRITGARVFYGVRKKVREDLFHQARIT